MDCKLPCTIVQYTRLCMIHRKSAKRGLHGNLRKFFRFYEVFLVNMSIPRNSEVFFSYFRENFRISEKLTLRKKITRSSWKFLPHPYLLYSDLRAYHVFTRFASFSEHSCSYLLVKHVLTCHRSGNFLIKYVFHAIVCDD